MFIQLASMTLNTDQINKVRLPLLKQIETS